jgi:hypothetical protein
MSFLLFSAAPLLFCDFRTLKKNHVTADEKEGAAAVVSYFRPIGRRFNSPA